MKVRQYASFEILSDKLSPEAISEVVGRRPTTSKAKHSINGVIPKHHLWIIKSGLSDALPLGDHFDALLPEVEPYVGAIAQGVEHGLLFAQFSAWRNFDPSPEDPAVKGVSAAGSDWARLGGQHPLLGFNLGLRLVGFAARTGCEFVFDEYDEEIADDK